MRIYRSGTDLINKQKELTIIASTNNKKKIFSLMGDVNRMRTSNKTIMEKRKIKK
jgi:hypothetical protein